ncbi:MAG: Uma2 family endonuclease [Chloroflexota bacterium]
MRTTFVTDPPQAVEDWLERRRALGQDRFDEVWEGEYHVAPAPSDQHADVDHQVIVVLAPYARRAGLRGLTACNVGTPDDFRVPDQAYVRDRQPSMWHASAAIVVEILSPGDETRRKLGFYHRAGVEEMLLVDPHARTVEWLVRGPGAFEPAGRSPILGVSDDDLTAAIDWPG